LVGGADFVVIVVRQLHLDGHYARCGTSLKASILQALADERIRGGLMVIYATIAPRTYQGMIAPSLRS
jgi:hypothetical protein